MGANLGSGERRLRVKSFFDYIANKRILLIRQKKRAAEMAAFFG
jgi:hypothetical protein